MHLLFLQNLVHTYLLEDDKQNSCLQAALSLTSQSVFPATATSAPSLGIWGEMQKLRLCPDLLSENLHFDKIPRQFRNHQVLSWEALEREGKTASDFPLYHRATVWPELHKIPLQRLFVANSLLLFPGSIGNMLKGNLLFDFFLILLKYR